MKKLIYISSLFLALMVLHSCNLDLPNPNAATEQEVLTTKDGLFALAIGINQLYATQALGSAILVPSVTTRETAIMTTFANLEELESGGSSLSGENGYTTRLFAQMMRVKGMTESLIASVPGVELAPGTASGLQAYGHLYRAMCLGHLAHNFEQVAILNSPNNDAIFADRTVAYNEAISLLQSAIDLINGTPPSDEFNNVLGGNISLKNALYAMLSRYHLMAGNYTESIAAADAVDLTSKSEFLFDAQNANPVFNGMFVGTVSYAPRSDFGLPASLPVDAGDMRVDFHLTITGNSSLNNLPVETLNSPFFNTNTSPIPVYRPGEMMLNKAEAYARTDKLMEAEAELNAVRQKMPADDVFGIGGGLTDTYTASGDKTALLAEIYKNRRIELFLIGTSLEDSRRFGRQEPTLTRDLTTERNRNFYPYPDEERLNNPNTPNDPSI